MTTNKETKFSCVDCHVQKCEKAGPQRFARGIPAVLRNAGDLR